MDFFMSTFTNDIPTFEPVGNNGKQWKVISGFRYYLNDNKSGSFVDILPGFVTDFASVPRIFWPIIQPYGKHGKAAIVHDYLYRYKKIGSYKIEKSDADKIFYNAMKVLGVSKWKCVIMYLAVKFFGQSSWNK